MISFRVKEGIKSKFVLSSTNEIVPQGAIKKKLGYRLTAVCVWEWHTLFSIHKILHMFTY